VAAAIATYAPLLGFVSENYEPIAWAEEVIEPALAVNHPRLGVLYIMASLCWLAGRIDESLRYCDAGRLTIGGGSEEVPLGLEGWLGSAYQYIGQSERWAEWCRAQLARGRDTHTMTRICLVIALSTAGCADEAMAAADGLIEAAETTGNPWVLGMALLTCGAAFRDADPVRSLAALRRALVIARDSGNRYTETQLAWMLSELEAEHGDRMAALDYLTVAIRNHYESGSTGMMHSPLALLAAFLDQLGRYEPAAIIAGFALIPLSVAAVPEITTAIAHLREILGNDVYEALARRAETMTTAEIVTYAYDQIDQARTELNAVSE
jgi:tetratricopeptide (TPR) repeat protein